jgi:hypothetical protein
MNTTWKTKSFMTYSLFRNKLSRKILALGKDEVTNDRGKYKNGSSKCEPFF